MCIWNFRAIFQLFFRLQVEKRPKIGHFRDFLFYGLHQIVICHPKKALRATKFFLGITKSPLKEFQPMVHRCLPYHGNVSGPKTIFGYFFQEFWIFEGNFWYFKCSDFDEILHGGSPWYEVSPVKILSKSVNFKGGKNIFFL